MHQPKHVIEFVLFRTVAGLVQILPYRVALALAWVIAAAAHFIGKVHVERTCTRVREVFGDSKSEKEMRHIAWIAWRNLIFSGVEQIRFSRLTLDKIRKLPIARLEGRLKAELDKCEGGCIIATPHCGNWEISAIAADLAGIPLFVLVRKQKNPLMDAYINKMRQSFNMEVVFNKTRMWKGVADRLKQGKVLALLPDVNQRNGITVDYLNGKATVPPGAARFAQMAQCPVYPVVARRIGWTKHDAVLLDPVYPDPAADKEADQKRMMQEIMAAFSKEVLKIPEQYFWYNKRWVLKK